MALLCTAENAVHNLHNLYTLRGAKVRDAKAWSGYLQETIEEWGGEAEVLFSVHHWPVWGADKIVSYLKMQCDIYKYIHDQTLRLANHGYNMDEIAEMMVDKGLPENLNSNWATRGYYGTLSHDVKAVYVFYLGWFDGNPATLNPLPRIDAGAKYLEYLTAGLTSVDALVDKALEDYNAGHYRWVVQLLNHVIYADPTIMRAKKLQADALEQLGYQAESGPWRNFYLSAAQALRRRTPPSLTKSRKAQPETTAGGLSEDIIAAMTTDMLFDYMAIRLDGFEEVARTETINLLWKFVASDETTGAEIYHTTMENGILTYELVAEPRARENMDATLTLTREVLDGIIFQRDLLSKVEDAICPDAPAADCIHIAGDRNQVEKLFGLMDDFNPLFNLVTPIILDQGELPSNQ